MRKANIFLSLMERAVLGGPTGSVWECCSVLCLQAPKDSQPSAGSSHAVGLSG